MGWHHQLFVALLPGLAAATLTQEQTNG